MKKIATLLTAIILVIVIVGCIGENINSNKTSNSNSYQSNENRLFAFPSALQMCKDDVRTALTVKEFQDILKETVDQFKIKPIKDWLSTQNDSMMFANKSPLTIFYKGTTGSTPNERSVLTVGYGMGWNDINADGIIWTENEQWHYQAYPDVIEPLKSERSSKLAESNICRGTVDKVLIDGPYMAIVATIGLTKGIQEIHLMYFEKGIWNLIWAPTYSEYSNWKDIPLSTVEISNSIEEFKVHRSYFNEPTKQDWDEVWRLEGNKYKMISTTKSR